VEKGQHKLTGGITTKMMVFLKVMMVFQQVGKGALADVRKRNQKKVLRVSVDEDAALKEERFLRNLVNAAEDAHVSKFYFSF